jgi:acyl-CoA reductase-like NAD-dependent aldehyde dehydrogenase
MRNQLFINGKWRDSRSGKRFATVNPSTEDIITEVSRGNKDDVDDAVQSAHVAAEGVWRKMHPADRGRLLFDLARAVEEHHQELGELESMDVGKPINKAIGEITGVCKVLEYNAGAADKLQGDTIPIGHDYVDFTWLEPLGVTAHIIPWNSPLSMAVRSVAPALAAGCTVVIKPAEESPLSVLRFAELAQEVGFPEGVINIVTGFGDEAGAPLVRHPLVRGVTFTGSVETGRKVMAMAAEGIKPVVLELGGKSPLLVFPDADLEKSAADAAKGILTNSGQVCVAASRAIVHRQVRDEFLERLKQHFTRVTMGPAQANCDLGPLASEKQYGRVMRYIGIGMKEGAEALLGGKRPPQLNKGFFVEPTIFAHVSPTMRVAREEIFGPVIAVLEFEEDTEAVALANDTSYGLAAGIYTRDITRGLRAARDIKAGIIWLNEWFMGGVQAPVGGYKESGIGRERGLLGVRNYLQVKNVAIRI